MDTVVVVTLAVLILAFIVAGISIWLNYRMRNKSKVTSDGTIANCVWSTKSQVMLDDDGRLYNVFLPTSGCHSAWAAARNWDGQRDPDYPYTSGAFFCLSNSMKTQIEADSSGHAIYINVEPLVIEVTSNKKKRALEWDDEFRLYTYEPHYQWKQKVMLDFVADERQFVNSDYPSGAMPGPDDITFRFSDWTVTAGVSDPKYVYWGDAFTLKVKQDNDAHVKAGPDCKDLHYPTSLTTNSCGDKVYFIINEYPQDSS